MSMKALKRAVKNTDRDEFEDGTVIRWTVSSGGIQYTYAAIKTPVGWFTTAQTHNMYVGQKLTFDKLLDVLSRSEVSDVAVAVSWQSVD